jgi:hypothetical protein
MSSQNRKVMGTCVENNLQKTTREKSISGSRIVQCFIF